MICSFDKEAATVNTRVFRWNPQAFPLPSSPNSDFAMNRFLISSMSLLLSLSPVNADTAPAGSDKTITVVAGSTYTFTDADWGFTDNGDSPPNNFSAVKLTTMPVAGTLRVDGVDVSGSPTVSRLVSPGGLVWTARDSSRYWNSVASSSDGTKLVAAVSNGQLYTSTDSGVTWTARESSRNWRFVASSADGTKLVAVVYDGQIHTSTDSGITWTAREGRRLWYSVASSADGTKLVAGIYNGQLYTSTDSGVTWTARENSRYWYSIASSADGTKLVAAANYGMLYTSTDSGVTWSARASHQFWYSVASSADGTKLVATTDANSLYTSTNSGLTWIARTTTRNWQSVASSADGTNLVAADAGYSTGGQLYTSTDSGITWTARDSSRDWRSVASSADGTKLIAAASGNKLYTSAGSVPIIRYIAPPTSGQQSFTFQVQDDGVSNNLDLSSNTITLNVITPPIVTTPTSANITSSGATLGGDVTSDGGSPIIERGVVYSVTTANAKPQIGGSGVIKTPVSGSTGIFSVPLTGLVASTRYSFAAYATNSAGTIYTAPVSVFSTSAAPVGTDKIINIVTGATHTFTDVDWGFIDSGDSPPDNFAAVKLTTLPSAGAFNVDGSNASGSPTVSRLPGPGGATWTARDSSRYWTSVASSADGTKLVAAVDNSHLHTSTDSGLTWTARMTDYNRNWSSVASSEDGSKLVAVSQTTFYPGGAGLIFTSADSGMTWTARMTDSARYWRSVASSADGTKLLAVTIGEYQGGLYTSTNSGVTWTTRELNPNWSSVASSADGEKLVAVVYGGQIYTSTDSGTTWTARDSSRNWRSVASSVDGIKLVAAVNGGQLYTSSNSGVTWTARMTDSNRYWSSVASSADGTKLLAAVTGGGQLYTSIDSGMTWTARGSNRWWKSVASSADGAKLVAAVDGGQIYTSVGMVPLISYTAPASVGPQSFTFQVQDDGLSNNLDLSPNTITFNVITPVEHWRQIHFGSSLNIGTAADTGDFDGDGVVNLLEFAFGTGPSSLGSGRASLNWNGTFASASLGSTGQPVAAVQSGGSGPEYRALFIRRTDYATAGLNYTVQFSSDLFTWGDSTATPTTLSSSGGYDLVGVPFPSGMQFFRVGVTLTP